MRLKNSREVYAAARMLARVSGQSVPAARDELVALMGEVQKRTGYRPDVFHVGQQRGGSEFVEWLDTVQPVSQN